jgi:hypothetical protein
VSDPDPKSVTPFLSDRFFAVLADLGERHGTDPVVFLDVWNAESGLNPHIISKTPPHARGLNQMIPTTLAGLHAPADFEALAAEDQVPWIEQLITSGERLNGGPFATAERYYHSNFFPRTMSRGSSPATVVIARDATDPEERQAYAGNAAMDHAGKGWIAYSDLAAFLAGGRRANALVYGAARARLALAMRESSPPAVARRSTAPIFLGLVGALAGAIAWRAAR